MKGPARLVVTRPDNKLHRQFNFNFQILLVGKNQILSYPLEAEDDNALDVMLPEFAEAVRKMFEIDGVDDIFVFPRYFTVCLGAAYSWKGVAEHIVDILRKSMNMSFVISGIKQSKPPAGIDELTEAPVISDEQS